MASSRRSGRTATAKEKTRPTATAAKSGRSRKRASFFQLLLDLLLLSWIGRVLLTLLVVAAVLGLNVLISGNQYDLFFILVGIELVVTALFFWLRLVLKRS